MPLITSIERDGELLQLHWGDFHIAAMVLASSLDSGTGPFTENTPEAVIGHPYEEIDEPIAINRAVCLQLASYPVLSATPMSHDAYVLKRDWSFVDVADGEVLALKAGDALTAYRN